MRVRVIVRIVWISAFLWAVSIHTVAAQTGVRIATWNIQAVGEAGSVQYDQALAILNRIQPDVVALNEIAHTADVGHLEDLAADAGFAHVVVPSGGGPFGAQRNAFLSNLPVIQQTAHTAAALGGDPNANDISRLIVEITVAPSADAKPLTLFVEHWKSGSGNDDEFRRAVESIRIAQAAAELSGHVNAYAILGDVNEEIDQVPRTPNPFTHLPGGLPASFRLGVDLAERLATTGIANDPFSHLLDPNGPAASALAALQLDGADATRPASGRRLDYILISPSLTKLNPLAEVYDSEDEGLPGGLTKFDNPPSPAASLEASDHLLVFADITVPARNDFNNDGMVNLIDLRFFAQHWLTCDCADLFDCLGTDLDQNNRVDHNDFVLFAEL